MAITPNHIVITNPDGSTTTIDITWNAAPVVVPPDPPDPTHVTFPDGANTVVIGNSASFALTAIDPFSNEFPGGRGVNQLIIITKSTTVARNQWGWEVPVGLDGKAGVGSTNVISIPPGGYVLSGHGTAAEFLKAVKAGSVVSVLAKVAPDPEPGTMVYPAREIALYKMMFSTNQPLLSTTPPEVNVVRMAFGMGSPLALIGYGIDGRAEFIRQANIMRGKGIPFVLSVGGSAGVLDLTNADAFVASCVAIKNDLGFLDGLDWDNEKGPNVPSQIRAIENALVKKFGSGFAITYTPGDIDTYLKCAVACHQAGQLTSYGQQFYDAEVSVDAAAGRIQQAINAGIPIQKISVGMMIASDAKHWTNAQCKANMIELRRRFPELRRVFLWEASRAGTAQWAADMKAIVNAT